LLLLPLLLLLMMMMMELLSLEKRTREKREKRERKMRKRGRKTYSQKKNSTCFLASSFSALVGPRERGSTSLAKK